jgi:hypothetical protein
MSEEQDRVAATQWANSHWPFIRDRMRYDFEDAYLAGLSAGRSQTAELVSVLTWISNVDPDSCDRACVTTIVDMALCALASAGMLK